MFRLGTNDVPKQLRQLAKLMDLLPRSEEIESAEGIIQGLHDEISDLQSVKNGLESQVQPSPVAAPAVQSA